MLNCEWSLTTLSHWSWYCPDQSCHRTIVGTMYVEMLDIKYLMGKNECKKLDYVSFSEGCLSLFFDTFFARLQNSEKRLLALSSLSVRPSFDVSVSPSVRVEKLGSRSADFHEIWYLRFLSKICWDSSSLITMWQEHWVLYMKTYVRLW